jgi:hypothetical protein
VWVLVVLLVGNKEVVITVVGVASCSRLNRLSVPHTYNIWNS